MKQKEGYDTLDDDGSLAFQVIEEQTGLIIIGVKLFCSKLQEYGILERNGSRRDGIWITK